MQNRQNPTGIGLVSYVYTFFGYQKKTPRDGSVPAPRRFLYFVADASLPQPFNGQNLFFQRRGRFLLVRA